MVALRERLAVALGVWAGATATPVVSFAAVEYWNGPPLASAVAAFLATAALGAGFAWIGVGRLPDPGDWFRDGLPAGTLIAVPGTELVAAIPAALWVGVGEALPFGVGGLVGALVGWGVGYVADSAVVRHKREATEHALTFTARKAPAPRWKRALAGVVVVAAVAWAAYLWSAGPVFAVAPGFVALAWLPTLFRGWRRRRYELLDGGLVTRFGHLPWDLFDTFAVTDDALVLHGNTWPFGRVAFDRESIEDLDAVVAALERNLPRASPDDGNGGGDDRPAGGLRDLLDRS